MAALGWAARGYSLLAISVLELITPLVRMIVLTRFLDLRELGFASALAATYGAFELTTDIAMNRFVFSRSRDEYAEALGAAPLTGGKAGSFAIGRACCWPGSGAGNPPCASAECAWAARAANVSGTIKRWIIKAVSPARSRGTRNDLSMEAFSE